MAWLLQEGRQRPRDRRQWVIEQKHQDDIRKAKLKQENRKKEMVKSREFNLTLIERKEKNKREERRLMSTAEKSHRRR